jgi:hypothetical protein
MGFYLETIPQALGIAVVVAALVGFVVLRRERSWRETLLLCWIVVPVAFFALWPVKGYTYLLPIAPPVAVLAARTLARLPVHGRLRIGAFRVPAALLTAGVAIVIATSLLVPSWRAVAPPAGSSLLAGAGGVPGGRETGRWMAEHVPEGAQVLTLGPSMANIVQYYALRKAYGLSVSSNELHRNPVYEPVPNPDRLLRQGDLQYLVWDALGEPLDGVLRQVRDLASRYHGTVIHREYGEASIRSSSCIRCGHEALVHARRVTCVLLVALTSVPAGASGRATAAGPVVAHTPIKHVVTLMQENHSFDNYFGTYPGAAGIPNGVCVPVDLAAAQPCVKPFLVGSQPLESLDHDRGAFETALNGGAMNGFVAAQRNRVTASDLTMGHYQRSDLRYYWNLADQNVLFDNFFSASTGGTAANHLFWVTGTSRSLQSDAIPAEGLGNLPTPVDRRVLRIARPIHLHHVLAQ